MGQHCDQPLHSSGDALNAAGRVTGLLGTYLVLWQLLLMTRQPWLDAGRHRHDRPEGRRHQQVGDHGL